MTLRLLDLFSGIGGFSYAAEHLLGGFTTTQFVECDPYCQTVLKKHWPTIPIHDDVRTYTAEPGEFDVVCGGFPCQDISTAGKGAGIKEGTRSGLFYELMRVVCLVRPRYVVLENVAAIRNRGLDLVLGELAAAGFDAEWACIRASDLGACHRRDRWWLVAYPSGQRRRKAGQLRSAQSTEWAPGSGQIASHTQGERWGAWPGQGPDQTGREGPRTGNGAQGRDAADAHHPRSQGQRTERQFPEGGSQKQVAWRSRHRLSSDWRSYLSEPVLCRGDDGLSNRAHRLKALGNSVVPQVAAVPLNRVLELHQCLN